MPSRRNAEGERTLPPEAYRKFRAAAMRGGHTANGTLGRKPGGSKSATCRVLATWRGHDTIRPATTRRGCLTGETRETEEATRNHGTACRCEHRSRRRSFGAGGNCSVDAGDHVVAGGEDRGSGLFSGRGDLAGRRGQGGCAQGNGWGSFAGGAGDRRTSWARRRSYGG
jgi:hypothetical protein